MALDRSNFNLFGLDLYRLYELGRQGFADLARWPLFQRLLPAEPVRLYQPDGSVTLVLPTGQAVAGAAAGAAPAQAAPTSLAAVRLPDDVVLAASLRLPASASPDECAQAAALAVQGASPFPPEDTVWGHRVNTLGGATLVHYALAARSHVERHLEAQRSVHALPAAVEVWAWAGDAPLVLPGHGEHRRQRLRRQRLLRTGALAALFLALLVALAAVPVLHRRQQAFDAQDAWHLLSGQTAPAAAAREALGRANLRLEALGRQLAGLPDPSWLLVRLTERLPDSVHLTQLDIKGNEATLRGTADNAGALIELLGNEPGISEVRPASAIVRNQASGRETFIIQLHYRVPESAPGPARAAGPVAPAEPAAEQGR